MKNYLLKELKRILRWATAAVNTGRMDGIILSDVDIVALAKIIGDVRSLQSQLKVVRRRCSIRTYADIYEQAEQQLRDIREKRWAMMKMAGLQKAIRRRDLPKAERCLSMLEGFGKEITPDLIDDIEALRDEVASSMGATYINPDDVENDPQVKDFMRWIGKDSDKSEDDEVYPGCVSFDEEFSDYDDEDGLLGVLDDDVLSEEDFGDDFPDGGTGSTVIPFTFPKREQTN